MRENELQFFAPTPRQRELQILIEIDRDPQVSQKELALHVGLAPSMVNNYMKQFCDEEKVQKCGPNHKRITYHLTEAGKRVKNDLLSEYLQEGLRLYHLLSEDLKRRLRGIREEGISRIAVLGAAEACEAIGKAARDVGLEVVATAEAMGETAARAAVGSSPRTPVFDGAQALLVADREVEEKGAVAIEGLKQRGLAVYRV